MPYMVCHLPSIYPSCVSIWIPYIRIRHGEWMFNCQFWFPEGVYQFWTSQTGVDHLCQLPVANYSPGRSRLSKPVSSHLGVSSSSWWYPNSWMVFVRDNPIVRNGWFVGVYPHFRNPPYHFGTGHINGNVYDSYGLATIFRSMIWPYMESYGGGRFSRGTPYRLPEGNSKIHAFFFLLSLDTVTVSEHVSHVEIMCWIYVYIYTYTYVSRISLLPATTCCSHGGLLTVPTSYYVHIMLFTDGFAGNQ